MNIRKFLFLIIFIIFQFFQTEISFSKTSDDVIDLLNIKPLKNQYIEGSMYYYGHGRKQNDSIAKIFFDAIEYKGYGILPDYIDAFHKKIISEKAHDEFSAINLFTEIYENSFNIDTLPNQKFIKTDSLQEFSKEFIDQWNSEHVIFTISPDMLSSAILYPSFIIDNAGNGYKRLKILRINFPNGQFELCGYDLKADYISRVNFLSDKSIIAEVYAAPNYRCYIISLNTLSARFLSSGNYKINSKYGKKVILIEGVKAYKEGGGAYWYNAIYDIDGNFISADN